MVETVSREMKIVNDKGLHARASAKFVECVEQFDADARVGKDGMETMGDSIMGLLMLAASYGTKIEVETSGPTRKSSWMRSKPWWATSSEKDSEP